MKHTKAVAVAVLLIGAVPFVYARMGGGMQLGAGDNPLEIQLLLHKFFEAQARAPFRYPTACVAGTAESYTQMALRSALNGANDAQLTLWTVPEEFGRVEHAEPDRQSGRCDYRVAVAGDPEGSHVIAEFFSRRRPRTGEIAYVKVWQEGGDQAVLVGFPDGPRGSDPRFTFESVPVGARLPATP